MSALDELVTVMNDCPDEATRQRLADVVRKLRSETPKRKKPPVQNRRIDLTAYANGRDARARGRGKNESAGTMRERNAWLAGRNDEDIKRGGK